MASENIETETKLPGFIERPSKAVVEESTVVGKTPYPTYPAPRIAGFDKAQDRSFNLTNQTMNSWKPGLDRADATMRKFMTDTWGDHVGQYVNPYREQVLQRTLDEMGRQGAIERNQIGRSALGSNAYGDDRHAILESEHRRNLERLKADTFLTGMDQAYTQGTQQYNSDRAARMAAGTASASQALQRQQQGYTDAGAQWAVGAQKQGQKQKGLDLAYQDFWKQKTWPMEMLNWRASILSGTPYSVTQKQEQPGGGGSSAGGIIGGLGALAGGIGQFADAGIWPFN